MPNYTALTARLDALQIAWKIDEPLAGHCTFKIGGPAAVYVQPTTEEQLCAAITLCKELNHRYYLLGNGSNVLFADGGYNGVVIDLSCGEKTVQVTEDGRVTAPAGAQLSRVCLAALEANLTGLEFAYGIPGTVGGAVYMNAGAYGGEIVDVLESVRVLTHNGEIETRPASALDLSYRHSIFEETGECILSAVFRLVSGDAESIRAKWTI